MTRRPEPGPDAWEEHSRWGDRIREHNERRAAELERDAAEPKPKPKRNAKSSG